MKTKIIYLLLMVFTFMFAGETFSKEMVKGTIIVTPQNIINVGVGEKIIANLGKNDGVIVGDIFRLVESDDDILIGHIGRCAVTKTFDSTSVCKVIKLSAEVGKGDYVYINKLEPLDPNIYPVVFELLNEIVKPYEPYNEVSVYVHNIYDENNNITLLSEKIRAEIINIFMQKNRMIVNSVNLSEYMTYPDKYFYIGKDSSRKETVSVLKEIMRRTNIDVVITGIYRTRGDAIELSLYMIDRHWADKKIDFALDTRAFTSTASEVILPYRPIKEKQFVTYNISVTKKNHFPTLDEKRYIVRNESEKDLSFKFKMLDKKIDFNRIGVDNFKFKIDGESIDVVSGKSKVIGFEKGLKRLWISFQPGFYMNEELFYSSQLKTIEKEVIIDLAREDNLNIELILDPTYGYEKADVKVYRKMTDEPFVLKSVYSVREKKTAIEVYRD